MLDSFRNAKDSIFFKGFLVLLAGSFAIFGIGDFMGGSSLTPGVILKVGDAEVRTDLFQRRFQREMDQFRQAMGGRQIDDSVVKKSVLSNLMQTFTQAAVVDAAARDMGLVISPEQMREDTINNDAFKENGRFTQMQFQRVLMDSGLTENAYLQITASDLRNKLLLDPVAFNAGAPNTMVGSLFTYRNETRSAETLLIPTEAIELQKTPTDDELKAVYDKNIAAYTAPEYRKVSALILSAGELVKPESIDDAAVQKYYDENLQRYRAPETRHLSQLVFDSKEKADAARALAAPGDTLETLATKAKVPAPIDLGELNASSPLAKQLAGAFTAQAKEITQPIQSPLGWHLVEVKAITPESTKTFDMVKEEVRKTIALDKGNDAVYDASTQMEDSLASGAAPDEVAKTVGARLLKIEAIDAQGLGKDGKPVPDLVDPQFFTFTAFQTAAGKDSRLMDLPTRDGYYILRVESVTPPTPKPILDVRPQVVTLWQTQEREKLAQAQAEALAKDIGPSTQLASLEKKVKGASAAPLGPLTRFGDGLDRAHVIDSKRVSPQFLDKLFAAKVGDVVIAPVATGTIVARLNDIQMPKAEGALAASQQELQQILREQIANDLMTQVTRAYTQRYKVEVDQNTLNTIAGQAQ